MLEGFGTWSPFEREVWLLPNAWESVPAEQQCLDRPYDYQLDCLACVRDHLAPDGRFLVQHRCVFKLPDGGAGETYAFEREGREWVGVDTYDPIQQVSVIAAQPADDPGAQPELDPCRDF